MTDEKQNRVLDASLKVFMRYGYRKVTMSDIAEEAGMSRPALYLVFPNKEEIFKAVVAGFNETATAEIRAGLPEHDALADKLRFAFEVWLVRPFELVLQSPVAKELTESSYAFADDVFEAGNRQFEKLLTSILELGTEALAQIHLTPDRLAHLAASSARGFKETAADATDLRQLISDLISILLAAVEREPVPR